MEKLVKNIDLGKKQQALNKFYENLGLEEQDYSYYSYPVGIERRKKILRMIDCQKEDNILDLGCGDGHISKYLVDCATSVTGIDLSATRIERAKKKGIKGIVGDATSTFLPSNSYSKIICSEVVEHVLDPNILFSEIYRLLEDKGCAIITVPINQELHKTLMDVSIDDLINCSYNNICKKYKLVDTHLSSFSVSSLTDLVNECGFKVGEIDYTYDYEMKSAWFRLPLYLIQYIYKIMTSRQINLNDKITEKIFMSFYRQLSKKHHLIVKIIKTSAE